MGILREDRYRIGKVLLLTLLLMPVLSVNLRAEDDTPDSSSTFIVAPAAMEERSNNIWRQFSYTATGIATTESDDVKNGFGFGVAAFYVGAMPIVPTLALDIAISSMKVDWLPDGDFVTFAPSLDLTLHGSLGKLRPFAGAGVNLYLNYLRFDEAAEFSPQGYDQSTMAREIDMGWGFAPHIRAGILVPINDQIGLVVQGRFSWISETAGIEFNDPMTGESVSTSISYDLPTVWFSVGFTGGASVRK